MYLDGLSFLDEEREAWRPYEALLGLTDQQLEQEAPGAHGWSGRDLMIHMSMWQGVLLEVARELAVGPESPTHERMRAAWQAEGDALNERLSADWRDVPLDEVRRRFGAVPGELRGYLTVVPEARWLKDPRVLEFFVESTTEHYEEHAADLQAVLAAAGH
jgi:hypothetical protein